jgi:site-specific DNA-adenine methylase
MAENKRFQKKIIHDYIGIDLIQVYDTIENDLTKLREKIEEIIKAKTTEKIFDREEIILSKDSSYYTHVRFEKIM